MVLLEWTRSNFWIRNSKQGQEEAYVELDDDTAGLKIDSSFVFFKYPAKQGDSYRPYPDDKEQIMDVLDLDVVVEVPAGKFKMIKGFVVFDEQTNR